MTFEQWWEETGRRCMIGQQVIALDLWLFAQESAGLTLGRLHEKIMDLQIDEGKEIRAIEDVVKSKYIRETYRAILTGAYRCGYRDARHAAAETAIRAHLPDPPKGGDQ